MDKNKGIVAGIIAFVLIVMLVNFLPWERQSSPLTQWLYQQSDQQLENSDMITSELVSGVEGDGGLAGEHKVNGSNWAIPNLLRHWILGD